MFYLDRTPRDDEYRLIYKYMYIYKYTANYEYTYLPTWFCVVISFGLAVTF